MTENDVGAVEMRGGAKAEEELGAVGVLASVGHGKDTTTLMLVDEVLVSELLSIDGLTAGAVSAGEVATLGHEAGDDSMEGAALEVEGLSLGAHALLASAASAEVLGGLGSVGGEIDHDSTSQCLVDAYIEENLAHCHNFYCLCLLII